MGSHNSTSLKFMSEAEELHLQLKVKIHPSDCASLYISIGEILDPEMEMGPL